MGSKRVMVPGTNPWVYLRHQLQVSRQTLKTLAPSRNKNCRIINPAGQTVIIKENSCGLVGGTSALNIWVQEGLPQRDLHVIRAQHEELYPQLSRSGPNMRVGTGVWGSLSLEPLWLFPGVAGVTLSGCLNR